MTRGNGGQRVTAVTWAAVAAICLVGVGVIWLSTTAGVRAGYGRIGSIVVLSLAILLTVVGAVVALWRPRMRRGVQLAVSVLLTVTACAVVPLVITDLVTGPGVGTLLVLAVAGMEVLAVHLIRAGRSTGRRKEQA